MKIYISLLFLGVVSCTSGSYRVFNSGDKFLTAVAVDSDDRRFEFGSLIPNTHKSYSGSMKIKKNPKPKVSWQIKGTNDLKTKEVEMPRGSTFGKTVVFEIIGDHVNVYYE